MKTTVRHASTKNYQGLADTLEARVVVESTQDRVIYSCLAIWDTGAMQSMITQRVADALNLEPQRFRTVRGVGGIETRPVYTISLSYANDLHFLKLQVVGIQELGEVHDALIGMDIISQLDFAITNLGGNTTHSIRFPSIAEIDFESSN